MRVIRKHWFISLLVLLAAIMVTAWFVMPGFSYAVLVAAERAHCRVYRMEVMVDDLPMAYLEGGDGEVILLLHGFTANKDHWTRVARLLTPQYRVIAVDLPGFGESGLVDGGDYSIEAQAERIRSFVRTLGLTRFHLGGSSTGGNIAGAYAARYPETVESLWLISPLGVSGAQPSDVEQMIASGAPSPLIIERPGQFGDVLDIVFDNRPYLPRSVRRHLAVQAAARYHHYQWVYGQIRDIGPDGRPLPATPLQPLLAGSPLPTLIVWGERDRVLDVSGAALLAEVMPNAQVEIMPRVGHLPMLERPEATAERYLEFLDALEADPT
jgi:abhydrolase domain-containing protein 6